MGHPWVKIAFRRGHTKAKDTKLYRDIDFQIYTLALNDEFWNSEINPDILFAEQRGI